MHFFLRFLAFLLLVGLLIGGGVAIYNAGVSAGIASDIGTAVASGDPGPVTVVTSPYVQPWGWGWGGGFFGFLFAIFLLFLFFGLLRAVFGWGRWGHHRDWGDPGSGGGYPGRYSGYRSHMEEWHREQHAEPKDEPSGPASNPA
ncbi:MAG TPA: hypothetical protein VIC63_00315 [Candidatus Limnocylindria bacterium]|jgi:hypothetical protein